MSIGFVFVVKYCLLFLIGIMINIFTDKSISARFISERTFYLSYSAVLITLFILDLFRYGGREKVNIYKQLFRESTLNRWIPTWLIFVQPVLVLLITLLIIEISKHYR
jgi:hypothetical protein